MTPTEKIDVLQVQERLINKAENYIVQLEQEITRLKSFGCELNKNYIRLDDPVLMELVGWMTYAAEHRKNCEWHNAQPCDCGYSKALSAYEARVKEAGK